MSVLLRDLMSDSPQISKNGIETIKHPSSTAAKGTRPSYPNTSGTSRTDKSRFTLTGEFYEAANHTAM